jgi:hypothetical protein
MKARYVLSTAAALLVSAGAAQAQRGHDDHGDRNTNRDPHASGAQPQRQAQPAPQPQQNRDVNRDVNRDGDHNRDVARERAAQQQQQQQIEAERRANEHRQYEVQERAQQAQLQAQQQAQRDRARDPYYNNGNQGVNRDPYYNNGNAGNVRDPHGNAAVASRYRYRYGSVYRETNQYGADMLQRAVNLGYRQGYEQGLNDRRGRVSPNYQRAYDYQQGIYGYGGNYVPQSDYSYYFRQGFERGYDDAYNNRMRYGENLNGSPSILGNVLGGILGFTMIR